MARPAPRRAGGCSGRRTPLAAALLAASLVFVLREAALGGQAFAAAPLRSTAGPSPRLAGPRVALASGLANAAHDAAVPSEGQLRPRALNWLPRLLLLLLGVVVGLTLPRAAHAAAAAATGEKLHLGQRLAVTLRSVSGLPDWAILMVLSALPLVELRGGVPVGLWMGLSVQQVMFLCILGNMIPMPVFLLVLRSTAAKKLLGPLIRRAETKTSAIGAHDRWVGVASFVGVPLPGTGAWTGAMVTNLLGMSLRESLTSILTGVCIAAVIMASLTLAGWYGCAIAVALVAVALGGRYLPVRKR